MNRDRHIFRIALAQMNSTVGDFSGNLNKIKETIRSAKEMDADLIAFPEMAITGYPPEDLLLKPAFIEDNLNVLDHVAEMAFGITIVMGFVDRGLPYAGNTRSENLYNAAAVIHGGRVQQVYHKLCLPNYGVFDEKRYFKPGETLPVFTLGGVNIGLNICEDIWQESGPTEAQASAGADCIININASPYQAGKAQSRQTMLSTRAKTHRVLIAYVNMVGGQDELVFDGGSMVVDAQGRLLARAAQFKEELMIVDLVPDEVKQSQRGGRIHADPRFPNVEHVLLPEGNHQKKRTKIAPVIAKAYAPDEEIYQALATGLFDYMHKNRFQKGMVAISGGIDSALTAAIAVDALGKDNVIGVFMPSQYTSQESTEDAAQLAKNLGIRLETFSITPLFASFRTLLADSFKGRAEDATEENLQSRIRGNIMMALSNKFGSLVLTTGNKSEMSVGYATLYGDMAGGFAVIKDLWKTWVYRLSEMRNRNGREIIPRRIIERAPTAELRPNQTDQDSLPPYETLDPILQAYIEENKHRQDIIAMGFEAETVSKVISLVDSSEFKRRQAPVGIKITPRAFGKDRRMPMTNRYRLFTNKKKRNKQSLTSAGRRKSHDTKKSP